MVQFTALIFELGFSHLDFDGLCFVGFFFSPWLGRKALAFFNLTAAFQQLPRSPCPIGGSPDLF